MKKAVFFFLLIVLASLIYSLDDELPTVLIELNSGYAFGKDLDSSMPIELKLVYPYTLFGFTVEFGPSLNSNSTGMHCFIGPTLFIINNPKIRLPISLGFDLFYQNTIYYGLGSIISFNYSLTRNIYVGINTEINLHFNNPYEEVVRIDEKDASVGIDPITGNKIYPIDKNGDPIYYTYTPIKETKDHFGSYMYIKPTIAIGIQF
jgi:hypothetical protein